MEVGPVHVDIKMNFDKFSFIVLWCVGSIVYKIEQSFGIPISTPGIYILQVFIFYIKVVYLNIQVFFY